MASPSRPLPSGSPRTPRFLPHSAAESALHASYLLVTVVAWPSAKGAFLTTVEWHTRGPLPPSFTAPGSRAADAAANGPAAAPGNATRVRVLVEREPLNAVQARERAGTLALRSGIPVVLTVGC